MAILPPTVWRIRPGGNVLNGAAYDGTTYPGGVDYTQQDSPQLSLTDLVGNGTTTLTSATGGFTSAMVGNAINITSGSGATVGYYFITARTDTNTVTIDRSPGTFTGGVGRVGGAAGGSTGVNPFAIATVNRASGNRAVPGNTVYVGGSGSDSPGSADYAWTGTSEGTGWDGWSFFAGNTTDGHIRFVGENGRPRISGSGLMVYYTSYTTIRNFYLTASSNSNGNLGILNISNAHIDNVHIDTNSKSGVIGVLANAGCHISHCEIWSGSTTPSVSSGAHGISISDYGVTVAGCRIHHMGEFGINNVGGMSHISGNLIYSNKSHGVYHYNSSNWLWGSTLNRNTIDGNGGDGISCPDLRSFVSCSMFGNLITNHTGAGKFGLNISTATLALVTAIRRLCDFNFFYNNTAHRSSNLAAGPNDVTLSADPYTSVVSFDYSLNSTAGGGAAVRAAGFPPVIGTYPATGFTRAAWPDGGAIQHQDAGGGGGGIKASPLRSLIIGGVG